MTSEQVKELTNQYILNTYGRFPVAIDHGEGAKLYDFEGKEYIDFTSGIGVTSLGYGSSAWADAVGAQAKKLGLVPYGRIIDTDAACPTLTFNNIARHQSRIVRVRVASNRSPWLAAAQVGDVYSVPISHGEGRFLADETLIRQLAANGQIATQYVDLDGRTTDDIHFNPNGSLFAVEGITSPDGRVFGKMGHAERTGAGLYKNVPGEYDMKMFASAVRYFR